MKLRLPLLLQICLISIVCLTACLKSDIKRETNGRMVTTMLHQLPNTLVKNDINYTIFVNKRAQNIPLKIACEGTSLTYGQNVPGVLPPINGASQTRALYQYPSTLQSVLSGKQVIVNVVNRGFPGDRTNEGLSRWKDSTQADVCILEYGTNDAFNFAGYAGGPVDTAHFHANLLQLIQRRLSQGSYVILVSPPQLYPVNPALNAYKSVISQVGVDLKIQVFDVAGIITGPEDYFDGVHLTAPGYQSWGQNIANLILSN